MRADQSFQTRLRVSNPSAKSIVVSQFTSLLSILQPLLTDAGFNWTRLDGTMTIGDRSNVIEEFQSTAEDTPTILLLSLRAGNPCTCFYSPNRA